VLKYRDNFTVYLALKASEGIMYCLSCNIMTNS
jgi:hypothetical protein